MKRMHQHCVTCTDGEWREIKARAAEAGMKISHFVVRCALEEEPSPGLALTEDEQRRLYSRVNLLLLACQDLTAALPGTDVTLREAVEFLWRAGGAPRPAPESET
ncbi:MAG: hypothetical protein F4Y03_14800 [Alphaproteobacteria bacterium]|nr:hypothetical protein [Alphaproteobacteria bacterium]MYE02510.1 hypothetical protein [Alphaproteobacteria bacterium]